MPFAFSTQLHVGLQIGARNPLHYLTLTSRLNVAVTNLTAAVRLTLANVP